MADSGGPLGQRGRKGRDGAMRRAGMASAMEDAGQGEEMPETARRELAARLRDLERDYDAKVRELKTQHQRRMDRLKEDRAEWDTYRRAQTKELADLKETMRRRTEVAQQRVDTTAAERKELADLREEVKRLESVERTVKRDAARLEAEMGAARDVAGRSRTRARWAAGALLLGAAGWLAAGWQGPLGLASLTAGLTLAALLLVDLSRSRPAT